MPVHWAGFALAMHHWKEPVERFTKECVSVNQAFVTPKIGEIFTLDSKNTNQWWSEFE